jgi:methanogenic corrinoid protein MtbC1
LRNSGHSPTESPLAKLVGSDTTALVGLPEAADRLGVHYMTAYRYVRTGRLLATIVNGVWQIDPADIRALTDSSAAPRRVRGDARLRAVSNFEQRLIEGDEAGSLKVCEESLGSWATPVDLYQSLLIPAMLSIGQRWETDELSVADEHRATAVAIRVMGRLGPHFVRPGRRRGTVVIGAPAGDRHSIPVMVVGDVLRYAGFYVVDLGADVPPESFVEAARRSDRLVAVAIGATLQKNEAAVAGAISSLHDAFLNLSVIAGGMGLPTRAAAQRVGADRWSGPNWDAVVQAATELESGIGPRRSQ